MKIVFMGTPEFSAEILKALVEAGHEITGVFTQPDKAKGRSGVPVASPVKEYALSKGFAVFQPDKIKRPENVEALKNIPADVFVVAAFGQILSQEILDIPKFGCINVHGSILPKYRGAAPIQRAIANGETETGVTIMQMDKGIDSGDIISIVKFPILDTDDEMSVYAKMADYGSKELVNVLKMVEDGNVTRTAQDASLATYAPMLTKEEGLLDFSKTAAELDCLVRGFRQWPTAYTFCNGKMIKVFAAKAVEGDCNGEGGILSVTKKNIYVSCREGLLELLEVQPEGKKRMSAMDFARGFHLVSGDRLTNDR